MHRRHILVLLAALLAAGGGFQLAQALYGKQQPPEVPALLWPNPKQLDAFTLTDHRGQAFDLERLQDKWTFLFFGYTHCPDVCPTTLATLDAVKERLERPEDVQFVFVSVDPQRDTAKHLGEYVTYFDSEFLGARAPLDELKSLTGQLGVVYMHEEPDENGDYEVGHSAAVMLTDPQARLLGMFHAPHDAGPIASQFTRIRSFVEG